MAFNLEPKCGSVLYACAPDKPTIIRNAAHPLKTGDAILEEPSAQSGAHSSAQLKVEIALQLQEHREALQSYMEGLMQHHTQVLETSFAGLQQALQGALPVGGNGDVDNQETEAYTPKGEAHTVITEYKPELNIIKSSAKEQNDPENSTVPHSQSKNDLANAKGWTSSNQAIISKRAQERIWNEMPMIQKLVQSNMFDAVFGFFIFANSVYMGVNVQMVAGNPTVERDNKTTFLAISGCFTAIFALELILRLLAFGSSFCNKQDRVWNMFDMAVVTITTGEFLLQISNTGIVGNANLLRIMRVLRFARAARVLRLARFFKELRLMVYSMMNCLRPLFWTLTLLTTVIYVCAIIFSQGVIDEWDQISKSLSAEELEEISLLYGTLWRSMYTLMVVALGGDDWITYAVPLRNLYGIYEWLLIGYVAFMTLALLNVVTGIFVDSTMGSAMKDRQAIIQEQLNQEGSQIDELRQLFQEADTDNTGTLSSKELEEFFEDDRVKAYLRVLEINVHEASGLFSLLDIDSSGFVDTEEFIMGCMRLKGGYVDVPTLMYENKRMITAIKDIMTALLHQNLAKRPRDNPIRVTPRR